MSARLSATARVVAAGVVLEARDRACVAAPDALAVRLARACLAHDPGGARLLRLIDSRIGRRVLRAVQSLSVPRIGAHYVWRKRRIERWARQHIEAGVGQVLILGAGWDALGLVLAQHACAPRVIEIDAPATFAIKRRALAALEDVSGSPLLLDADLAGEEIDAILARVPEFHRDQATLVVAEGLLMYLDRARVVDLAAALRRALSGPVHVIATAMSTDVHRRPGFRRERPWVRAWLRAVGEPFRWGIERSDLPAALAALAFTGVELAPAEEPDDPDPAPGEWVLRARF